MRIKSFLCVSTAAVVIAMAVACVEMQPLPTKTGKPEVIIAGKGVTKKKIVDRTAYYMISEGFKIDRVDDYAAIFLKHGSTWRYVNNQSIQEPQDERITINMLDSAEGINVIGTVETLTYPGGRGPLAEDESKYGTRAEWLHNLLWRVKNDLVGEGQKGLADR